MLSSHSTEEFYGILRLLNRTVESPDLSFVCLFFPTFLALSVTVI